MDRFEEILNILNCENYTHYNTRDRVFVKGLNPDMALGREQFITVEEYVCGIRRLIGYQDEILKNLEAPREKIAVYSGSFNPMHDGHLAIIDHLSREFDMVDVVVSPKNPLKDDSVYKNNFWQRYKDATDKCSLLENWEKVFVDRIEHDMEPPYYYINTLKKLDWQYEDCDIVPVFGADCLETIEKWYDWKGILRNREVCIVPRKGYNGKKLLRDLENRYPEDAKRWKIRFLDYDIPKISSTEIRNLEK